MILLAVSLTIPSAGAQVSSVVPGLLAEPQIPPEPGADDLPGPKLPGALSPPAGPRVNVSVPQLPLPSPLDEAEWYCDTATAAEERKANPVHPPDTMPASLHDPQTTPNAPEDTCEKTVNEVQEMLLSRASGSSVQIEDLSPGSLSFGVRESYKAAPPSEDGHAVAQSATPRLAPAGSGLGSAPWALLGTLGAGVAVALWLYRRVLSEGLLDNDLRQRMIEIIRGNPGINESRLAEEFDVHGSTVCYHGSLLEKAGHVVRKTDGREVVYYATDDGHHPIEREVRTVVRRDAKRRILELYLQTPGASLSEAARELECSPSTVMRHADDLVDRGILRDTNSNGTRHLEVVPRAEDPLERAIQGEAPA